MRKILILLMLQVNLFSKENYIIMADDLYMLRLFRDNRQQVIEIAEEISIKYDGVIFHLGNMVIFDRGGMFYYNSSQENLKEFVQIINRNNKKIYFWFLDSFGSDKFDIIYNNHIKVIKTIYPKLLEFEYDGIVIDLEWINYNENDEIRNNRERLKEIINNIEKNLRKRFMFLLL